MSKDYIIRTTHLAVLPRGADLFAESVTNIFIEDDAGGEFIKIEQQNRHESKEAQVIGLDPEEWPMVRKGVEMLLAEIEKHKDKEIPTP